MALWGSISISVEIKSAADKFYNLWKTQVYHLPNISGSIQKVEVHEGDWHFDGAVKLWNYTLGGKALTAKEKVSFDDANKAITFVIVDGDILKEFKSLKVVVKASPKADGKSIVTWTTDYEKLSENVATPLSYLALHEKITGEVDAHLLGEYGVVTSTRRFPSTMKTSPSHVLLLMGDLPKEFKDLIHVMKVIPKADGKSIVSRTIDYEKATQRRGNPGFVLGPQ